MNLRQQIRETAVSIEAGLDGLLPGRRHHKHLEAIDTRIVVSGVRGKSSAATWLHQVFTDRGYNTFTKVTGDQPHILHNDERHEIVRGDTVKLYENATLLADYDDLDVAIFENQGIRQYTTRLINERFVSPNVVFLTNIREDHLDTLGRNRLQIARSLARSIPDGTTVISGEQDETLREYLTAELQRRNTTIHHVDLTEEQKQMPGAEVVFGVSKVLTETGELALSESSIRKRLEAMQPSWSHLPSGLVYNAASVNDVQSTNIIVRSLMGDDIDIIEPLVYLRGDRRGRTHSFLRYFRRLVDNECIHRVHAVGGGARVFAANAEFEVFTYDDREQSAAEVLDEVSRFNAPVVLMGNTVAQFMRDIDAVIEQRTTEKSKQTTPIQ